MIFRLTQKLNKKIKTGSLETAPLDDNPFADWTCHLFTANRRQYILLSNTKTFYSCVMNGKGITNGTVFIKRALNTIRELMEANGQVFVYSKFIAPESESVQFAKSLNRTVIGSVNNLAIMAGFYIDDGMLLPEINDGLNGVPMSGLGKPRGYDQPGRVFHELVDEYNMGDQLSSI